MSNTGYRNTGDRNTGNWNTGDRNTGDWNTGDRNTGDWNTGDRNTGFFNTTTPETINIFNKPAKQEDWRKAKKPDCLFFSHIKFVESKDMTKTEKEAYPTHNTIGGYLKTIPYKEAFSESLSKANTDDLILITKLPNFDNAVFKEISGTDLLKLIESRSRHTIIIDGKSIVRSHESCEELRKQLL